MGNGIASCFSPTGQSAGAVKLVFWGGATELLPARRLAGELMFESPDSVVCRADAFYVGRPFPVLSLDDALLPGHTYFVLPLHRLRPSPGAATVTAASLASLSPAAGRPAVGFAGPQCRPFEYVKGRDGRTAIKVVPEFIASVITAGGGGGGGEGGNRERSTTLEGGAAAAAAAAASLCSTPELQKHYAQLVGSTRERPWSPQLETIKEDKNNRSSSKTCGNNSSPKWRLSPVRFLGLDRRSS